MYDVRYHLRARGNRRARFSRDDPKVFCGAEEVLTQFIHPTSRVVFLRPPDKEYNKTIRNLVNKTIVIITAWEGNDIIGVDGYNRINSPLCNICPIVWGYTVVKHSHQGRGIGTQIALERKKALSKTFAFHKSIIRKDNVKMIKIVTKMGYKFILEDDKFVYHLKTYNKFLSFISLAFIPLYTGFKRANALARAK